MTTLKSIQNSNCYSQNLNTKKQLLYQSVYKKSLLPYKSWIYKLHKTNLMKKLNKKYADLLHQASIATGRKEAVGLLHKAAKLQTKFDEKANL